MAITAQISSSSGDRSWTISYDDTTRDVTCTAVGSGFDFITVQITASVARTVAVFPAGGGQTQNADLAARMAAADFAVTANGSTTVLASGINPNQVARIVGKSGQVVGGLPSSDEWRPV
jgi:hypothetical protein